MTIKLGPAGKIASFFINSKLTPLIIIASILLGIAAIIALPREEEPQIIVPMIDMFVQMPGANAKEVEQRVTKPMEKLLWEIPGVEYIYSTSMPGMSMDRYWKVPAGTNSAPLVMDTPVITVAVSTST